MPAYIFTVTTGSRINSINPSDPLKYDDNDLAKVSARVLANNLSDAMRLFAVNRKDIHPPFKISVHLDRYEEIKTSPAPIPQRG